MFDSLHPMTDIVVLSYNNRKITEKCLIHLYKNTKNFHIYLVDNKSKDDTISFIKGKNYDNLTLIENDKNSGVAGGRNIGVKAGNSEYVICLDNDQFATCPNWLHELFAIHEKGYDMVGVDAWEMHPPTYKMRPYFPKKRCETKFDKFSYVGGGGTLIPRKIFEEVDFFDDYYSPAYFEDSDFFFKASQSGYNAAWHFKNKILHLGHQTLGVQKDYSLNSQFQKSYKYFVEKWMPYFPRPGNSLLLERMIPELFGVA